MKVKINLKQIGERKPKIAPVTFEYSPVPRTLRELIAQTAEACVNAFNGRIRAVEEHIEPLSEERIGELSEVGKIAFGISYGERGQDPESVKANAINAFENGIYRVFLNGTELTALDKELEISENDSLTFIRLTMLGGSIFVNDLGIDINQFMNSHLKFYNTEFSDLKFEYKIANIVYDDGSRMIEDTPKESMESKKVTVNVTDKKNLDINYNVGRYSPRVEFTFKVCNSTSKNIKGVQGILSIKDLFGVDIMSSSLDFTGQIIGANDSIVVSGMGIDINQFKDDHVKIYNTNFDDLKFEYEITSIIYEDGTTE